MLRRYSAIMHPLGWKRPTKIAHFRVRKIHKIIGIWLVGFVISSPELFTWAAIPFCYDRKLYFNCRIIVPVSIVNSYYLL